MKAKNFSQRQANTVLFITVLVFTVVQPAIQALGMGLSSELSALINQGTELLLLFVPLIIFFAKSNVELKSALRIKCFSVKDLVCVLIMAICGYIVIIGITGTMITWVYQSGGALPENTAQTEMTQEMPWLWLLSAVVAAPLFEEFLMRGVLLSGYRWKGTKKAVLLTALIFALLHGNMVMIPSTFLIGLVFGYIAIGAESIWLTVVYHAVHNLLACTGWLDIYVIQLPWTLGLMPPAETEIGSQLYGIYQAVLFLAAALIFGVLFWRMIRKAKKAELTVQYNTNEKTYYGFLAASLCILAVMVLLSIVTYYMA